jgi:hypothetical protein
MSILNCRADALRMGKGLVGLSDMLTGHLISGRMMPRTGGEDCASADNAARKQRRDVTHRMLAGNQPSFVLVMQRTNEQGNLSRAQHKVMVTLVTEIR